MPSPRIFESIGSTKPPRAPVTMVTPLEPMRRLYVATGRGPEFNPLVHSGSIRLVTEPCGLSRQPAFVGAVGGRKTQAAHRASSPHAAQHPEALCAGGPLRMRFMLGGWE